MPQIILMFLFALFTGGCVQGNANGINFGAHVENFRHEGEYLLWDEMDGALSYELHINEDEYIVYENEFDLRNIDSGNHEARVRARLDDRESRWTSILTFTLSRSLEHPKYPVVLDGVLYWNAVADATHYLVDINGDEVSTESIGYPLADLPADNVYSLRVRAAFEGGVSNYSATVHFHTHSVDEIYDAAFNILTVRPLVIEIVGDGSEYVLLDGYQKAPAALHSFDGQRLTIDYRFLNEREETELVLDFITGGTYVKIVIDLFEESKPYMISDNALDYVPGEDIVLEFELFGGTFVSLSGNGITSAEWSENDGVLIIKHTFVDRLLDDNPDRETVILGYQLKKDDYIVIGYIFISIVNNE